MIRYDLVEAGNYEAYKVGHIALKSCINYRTEDMHFRGEISSNFFVFSFNLIYFSYEISLQYFGSSAVGKSGEYMHEMHFRCKILSNLIYIYIQSDLF